MCAAPRRIEPDDTFRACLARWAFRTFVGTMVATWFALAATKGSAGFLGCVAVLVATAVALAWTDFVARRRGALWFSDWLRFGWYWVAWLQIALVPEMVLGLAVLDLAADLVPASFVGGVYEASETILGAAVATALFAAAKLSLLFVLGGVSLLVRRGWQRSFERTRRRRWRGPPTSAPRPAASR